MTEVEIERHEKLGRRLGEGALASGFSGEEATAIGERIKDEGPMIKGESGSFSCNTN